MGKTIFTGLLILGLLLTVKSQTYLGKVGANLSTYRVDQSTVLHCYETSDSLIVLNRNLTFHQGFAIPPISGSTFNIHFLSKYLFDSDNALEFLVVYYNSSQIMTSIQVFDNGTGTALPNLSLYGRGGPTLRNFDTGSQLIIYQSLSGNDTCTVYELAGQVLNVSELQLTGLSNLHPNPTKDVIHLNGMAGESARILDVDGQLIKESRLGGMNTEIDVSELSPGVYFVQTESGESFKFVKQ